MPGHSAGSIGLFNNEHRLLMSGDTIYADGAIGRYDLVSANPADLKRSLELDCGPGREHSLALSQPDREERGRANDERTRSNNGPPFWGDRIAFMIRIQIWEKRLLKRLLRPIS